MLHVKHFFGTIGEAKILRASYLPECADQADGHLALRVPRGGDGASLTGTKNPVQVTLTIGDDRGLTSVTARIR
jgi:hypothetical protein